jgi:hypothetical protein
MSQDLVRYRCKESDCALRFYTPYEHTASSCPYCLGDITREDDRYLQSTLGVRRKRANERFKKSTDVEHKKEED